MTRSVNVPAILPPSVTAICPGIHAVGGVIDGGAPPSWAPRQAGRWLSTQCYAIQSGDECLLVDTGLAVHRSEILRGVGALLDGRVPRMTMTRWEPDAIINLPEFVREFAIRSVIWSGPLNPLDFFEGLDNASAAAGIKAATGVSLERCTPGTVLKVGDMSLEIIRPNFAVLATYWFYEAKTRTLFSSDCFGFVSAASKLQGPAVCRGTECDVTVDLAVRYIRGKFDWMVGIDTSPIVEDILGVLSVRRVDRICPSFGSVIEGPAAVQQVVAATVKALETVAQQRRASAHAGLDWEKVRAALKSQ